jgi:hypothetical protein
MGSVVLSLAAMSFAAQSQGGSLDLGGLVRGTVNGLTGGGISAKAGATVRGSDIDAKAKASLGRTVDAKAKVILFKKKYHAHKIHKGKHHGSAQIYAKVDLNKNHRAHKSYKGHPNLATIYAKVDTHPIDAKLRAGLGKAAAAAKVKITFGSGQNHPRTSQPPSSTPGAMASRLLDLSRSDRDRLATRCVTVLGAPQRYDDTLVSLCRMITTL